MTKLLILIVAIAILGLIALRLYDTPVKLSEPVADGILLLDRAALQAPATAPDRAAVPPFQAETGAVSALADEWPAPDQSIRGTIATTRALGADVEQALIASESDVRFEMTHTLTDDFHFDELISALDSDLAGLELGAGILPLIYEQASANEITVHQFACGEKVRALRVYGPSWDTLEAYLRSITEASEGMVLSKNWDDRINGLGWIERMIILATEQSANGFLYENSRG